MALREKEFGIWQSVSWQEYYDRIRYLALGLLELGYEQGDKLSVIGDNRPEWLYSELAIQALGGAVVGIYPDSHLEQVRVYHRPFRFRVRHGGGPGTDGQDPEHDR